MSINIADAYYLKAANNYPYHLEFVTENLNYALSYDENHAQALFLMGRLHMEILKDYNQAEFYFEQAIINDLNFVDTYKYFSLLKIWQGEYEKAEKIIAYGMKVKGMDRSILLHRKALILEAKGQTILAKKLVAYAMRSCLTESHIDFFNEEARRLQIKSKAIKKLKKSYETTIV